MFWVYFGRFISNVDVSSTFFIGLRLFGMNIKKCSSLFTEISLEMKTIPQLENLSSAPMPWVKAHMKYERRKNKAMIMKKEYRRKKNTKNGKNKLLKLYIK